MKAIDRKLIIIAAAFSLIATLLIYQYLSGLNQPEEEQLVTVFVAGQNIPARSIIVREMIREISIPVELRHPESISAIHEIIGKMSTDKMIAGEQILLSRLAGEQKNQLSYKIPEGKRAVSISANEVIIVSNLIKPGDSVDILLTIEPMKEENGAVVNEYIKSTGIIMQNIEVLAIGQRMYEQATIDNEIPRSITLAVTPAESEQLVLAEESGRIRLALRPAMDHDTTRTTGSLIKDIAPDRGIVQKAPSYQGGME